MSAVRAVVAAVLFVPLVLVFAVLAMAEAAREARLKQQLGDDYEGPAAGGEDAS